MNCQLSLFNILPFSQIWHCQIWIFHSDIAIFTLWNSDFTLTLPNLSSSPLDSCSMTSKRCLTRSGVRCMCSTGCVCLEDSWQFERFDRWWKSWQFDRWWKLAFFDIISILTGAEKARLKVCGSLCEAWNRGNYSWLFLAAVLVRSLVRSLVRGWKSEGSRDGSRDWPYVSWSVGSHCSVWVTQTTSQACHFEVTWLRLLTWLSHLDAAWVRLVTWYSTPASSDCFRAHQTNEVAQMSRDLALKRLWKSRDRFSWVLGIDICACHVISDPFLSRDRTVRRSFSVVWSMTVSLMSHLGWLW